MQDFKLDINDYPELKERLLKQSMRYYLSRFLYKKPNSDEFMSLDRIEDLFSGYKMMLSYLVEDLVHQNKLNEAKGLVIRHHLGKKLREETIEILADVVYDPNLEPPPFDVFGPLQETESMRFPEHVKLQWI